MEEETTSPAEQSDEEFGQDISEEGTSEESSQPEGVGEELEDETIEPKEYEIGGKKYTEEELLEALQAREDYQHLLPEFTRRSQRLAELEKQIAQIQQQPNVSEDEKLAETKRLLKEQLGVVTREDLERIIADIQDFYQGDIQLQRAVAELEKKYSGANGEPKFDYEQLKDYLVQKYGEDKENWPDNIDLEYEYWDMNRDYFSQIPKVKSAVAQTERRSSTPFSLAKKKIKFEPTGKGEVSVEDAAKEILRQSQIK